MDIFASIHVHLIHWVMDFIGVHNGEDQFSTRMYNFWSGFGGNISVLALVGTVIGVYRHNLKRLEKLHPLQMMTTPLSNLVHKNTGSNSNSNTTPDNKQQ